MESAYFLPCPFCGGPAEFEFAEADETMQPADDGTGRVVCQHCGAQTDLCGQDRARELWNTRAG